MSAGRRRWVAIAGVLVTVGVGFALVGAGVLGPGADPASVAAAAGPSSVTVTVSDAQLSAERPMALPVVGSGSTGVFDGLPRAGFEEAGEVWALVEGEDGRDYSVAPVFEYSTGLAGPADTAAGSVETAAGSVETAAGSVETAASVAGAAAGDADAGSWVAPADPTAAVTGAVAAAEVVGVHQAVVVIDRGTGAVLTQLNANEPFPALSLVKLMIAADVLTGSHTDAGADDATAGTDDATRAWMREMIATSDDVTAADFYEPAGADELVDRVVQRFGLTGSSPTPDGEYWGNVQTTAADMAVLLDRLLAGPATAGVVGPAMRAATAIAADGVDQRFGMRTVPGAGSKQGWGCCLSGVVGIHSVGFTADRIVVVLSDAETDDESLGEQDGLALQADPGAQVSMKAVTDTVRAALGGPAS